MIAEFDLLPIHVNITSDVCNNIINEIVLKSDEYHNPFINCCTEAEESVEKLDGLNNS